jgi:hypothetical protein
MEDAEWWPAMGERMRLIRGALNLSEEAAAEACQVSLKTRYEAGAQQRTRAILNFSEKLDVCLDYLCRGDTRRLGRHLQITQSKVAILKA